MMAKMKNLFMVDVGKVFYLKFVKGSCIFHFILDKDPGKTGIAHMDLFLTNCWFTVDR